MHSLYIPNCQVAIGHWNRKANSKALTLPWNVHGPWRGLSSPHHVKRPILRKVTTCVGKPAASLRSREHEKTNKHSDSGLMTSIHSAIIQLYKKCCHKPTHSSPLSKEMPCFGWLHSNWASSSTGGCTTQGCNSSGVQGSKHCLNLRLNVPWCLGPVLSFFHIQALYISFINMGILSKACKSNRHICTTKKYYKPTFSLFTACHISKGIKLERELPANYQVIMD